MTTLQRCDTTKTLSLPKWAVNAARRLASLRQPGAYTIMFVVEPEGKRRMVVNHNPVSMEELGDS